MTLTASQPDTDRDAEVAQADETVEAVDRIVDYAFWQLMLQDNLEAAGRDVELTCAAIRFRWAQVLRDVAHARLEDLEQ